MAYTTWVLIGFVLAAAYNILGIVMVSMFFTNKALFATWPGLFGREGCFAIFLWGLAYLSVCVSYREVRRAKRSTVCGTKKKLFLAQVPFLVLAFALEKLLYVVYYIVINVKGAASKDDASGLSKGLATVFIKAFGLGDFVFMVFFLYVGFATFFGAERPYIPP